MQFKIPFLRIKKSEITLTVRLIKFLRSGRILSTTRGAKI
jgi:hypothetical protein